MVILETSTQIKTTPLSVWSILGDASKYPEFFKLASDISSPGAINSEGTDLNMVFLGIFLRLKVTKAQSPSNLSMKSYYGMRAQFHWRLEPCDVGTEVHLQVNYLTPYSVKGVIVEEEATRTKINGGLQETMSSLKELANPQ